MKRSSQRRAVVDGLVDAQAVVLEAAGAIGEWLAGVDRAIGVDMQDDADWKQADSHFHLAEELSNDVRVKAEIIKGRRRLHEGMQKDMGDTSKEQLRARIVPHIEKLERIRKQLANLARGLDQ